MTITGGVGHRHRTDEPSGNYFVFSDSTLFDVVDKLHAGGDAQESRSPHNTLLAMQGYLKGHEGALNGKTVVLGSLTNNLGQKADLEEMIKLAHEQGAAKIVVVGMGDRPDLAAKNPLVQQIVRDAKDSTGKPIPVQFVPLGPTLPGGMHSADIPGLSNNIVTAAGAEVAPVAPVVDHNDGTVPRVDNNPTRVVPGGPQRRGHPVVAGPTGRHRVVHGPGATNRHDIRHPGGPHLQGADHVLVEALHGRATRAGAAHMLKIEHALGVHVTDGAFGAHTIRDLQHKLHDRQTGVLNGQDVHKIEEMRHHHRRHPVPGQH